MEYHREVLTDLELQLKDLSIQMINLLKKYREKGIINETQYKQYTKVKLAFLDYLKRRDDNTN